MDRPSRGSAARDRVRVARTSRIRRELVKDSQWGTIPLLAWEDDLLLHPIVARLHNILQNSTAFRVYPSLRTSRYVHSIGVMHVASEMFRSVLVESDPVLVGTSKRAKAKKMGAGIRSLDEEALILANIVGKSAGKQISKQVRAVFPLHLGNGELATDEFHIAFAALRLAALLHDIGHLPGSHIFEIAIADTCVEPRRTEFVQSLESGAATIDDFLTFAAKLGLKLHERVGEQIIGLLADELESHKKGYAKLPARLLRASTHILHNTAAPDATLCFHSFLDSTLDADRIDFVRRDCETSGLLRCSVDFGRLLRFVKLKRVNIGSTDPQRRPQLAVMPDLRARADIEKLLMERFQDYSNIAAHHRVHLGDELLARCIRILLKYNRLDPIVNVLLKLSGPESGGETAELGHKFDQFKRQLALCTKFDDAWLENEIRKLWLETLEDDGECGLSKYERLVLSAHILSGSTLESAFRRQEDFVDYIDRSNKQGKNSHVEWFRETERLFAGPEPVQAFAQLNFIASAITEQKLEWEEKLFAKFKGNLIIVGDLSKKLKTGCPPTSQLISDQMEDLIPASNFLNAKLRRALVMNIWFEKTISGSKDEIIRWVCHELSLHLKPAPGTNVAAEIAATLGSKPDGR